MSTRLRTRWSEGGAAIAVWFSTYSPSIAEGIAGLDFDVIVIDLQHGLLDENDATTMMRAMARTDATILCRVPSNKPGVIGRVLDAGAAGVIVPMVNSAADAQAAVRAARYAPDGERSFGPTRARLTGRTTDVAEMNDATLVIPMIETVQAVEHVEEIAAVDGGDALYVGPSDLSITLGLAPRGHHDDERFLGALERVLAAATAHGVAPAIHADASLAARRLDEGWSMVTVVTDIQAAMAGASDALDAARRR